MSERTLSKFDQSEIWKPIAKTNHSYEVSNIGRVRSLDRMSRQGWSGLIFRRGKILKQFSDKDGYLKVSIRINGVFCQRTVHRLVAETFLSRGSFREVNHKDCDKTNNSVINLEWVSRQENHFHAVFAGRYNSPLMNGRQNPHRAKKLTLQKVDNIRALAACGNSYYEIAKIFAIAAPTVGEIVRKEIWR